MKTLGEMIKQKTSGVVMIIRDKYGNETQFELDSLNVSFDIETVEYMGKITKKAQVIKIEATSKNEMDI